MGTQHREVEHKYDVDADLRLPSFDGVAGSSTVTAPEEHQLEATYYDTADLRLAAARITLRRRAGGPDEGWHLKLPGSGSRTEVHEPLDGGTDVPPRLRSAVEALVRGSDLAPVAVIRTRRTAQRLLTDDGRALAEVDDDEVCSTLPADPGDETRWREVEVELVDGDEDVLAEIGEALRRAGATPSGSASKLARALGDRLPGARVVAPRNASDPAAALVQFRLVEQIDALVGTDPLVREDLPGSVHRMRVATRRLRSALATYRPFLGREVTDPVRAELKWLGDLLGEARDAEVQGAALVELLDDLSEVEELARGATLARMRVRTDFGERYRAAHERCLEALRSDRYRSLIDSLDQLVAHPSWTQPAGEPIEDAIRRRTRHEWRRVAKRAQDADDDTGLHETRKALKRLRYAVEPLRAVYGKDAKSFVKRLRRIQDVLGAHHDSITLRAELVELAERATEQGESALALGVVYARQVEDARRLAAQFEVSWPSVAKKSRRRWLG